MYRTYIHDCTSRRRHPYILSPRTFSYLPTHTDIQPGSWAASSVPTGRQPSHCCRGWRYGVVHDMMARASQPPLHTVSEQLQGEPCQHPGTIATACAHSHTDRRGGQHVTDGMGDLGYPMSLCVSENPSCLFDTDEEVQYVLYEIRISYVQVVSMSTPPSQESRTARDISRPFRPLLYLLYVSLPRLDSPYPSVRASMR